MLRRLWWGRAEEGKIVFSKDPKKHYLHRRRLSRCEFQGRIDKRRKQDIEREF
jgi:hypothetical protein